MRNFVYIALIAAASAATDALRWDYKKVGEDWTGECATGKKQSPIDLSDSSATAYAAAGNTGYGRQNYSANWRAVSQELQAGHTATYGNANDLNSAFTVSRTDLTAAIPPAVLELTDGWAWTLQSYAPAQFHVHTPSEHTINGIHQDLELHIVTKPHGAYAKTKAGSKHAAAFGIFFKALDCSDKVGDENLTCEKKLHETDDIFAYMAIEQFSTEFTAGTTQKKSSKATKVDYSRIMRLFDTNKFWRYEGGLTTPPCHENVTWTVLQDSQFIRASYYDKIKAQYKPYNTSEPSKDRGNRRKIQALNGRTLMKVTNTDGAIALMTAGAAVMSSYLLF